MKKTKTVHHGFIEIVNESKRKPSKLWADKGEAFYNSLVQKWFDDNDILLYFTHNEGKSVVTKRFIRTLKAKIY